jgi:hypothetical protein
MRVCTCLRPNIHQNGPKILGVNVEYIILRFKINLIHFKKCALNCRKIPHCLGFTKT